MNSVSSATIQLTVNGTDLAVTSGLSVADWLAEAGRDPRSVAIELNGDILPRGRYAETVFVDGDKVEMVQFVQGG